MNPECFVLVNGSWRGGAQSTCIRGKGFNFPSHGIVLTSNRACEVRKMSYGEKELSPIHAEVPVQISHPISYLIRKNQLEDPVMELSPALLVKPSAHRFFQVN